MSKEILIIDLETTHFLDKGGKIAEVGIVALDLHTGNREILFDKVCNEQPLTVDEIENSWIVKNGYMNASEIINAEPFDDMKADIQYIINQYGNGATAYNNAFDFGFLESRNICIPKKLACPMLLATDIIQIPATNAFYRERGDYKWPNVEEAWNYFFPNTRYIEKHRGADDAFHEALIVKELYDRKVFGL